MDESGGEAEKRGGVGVNLAALLACQDLSVKPAPVEVETCALVEDETCYGCN